MTVVVTGATGKLGRLVIDELRDRAPEQQVAAVVRNPERAADLAARGVQVRVGDYDDPASLRSAIGAGDRVLLISGNQMGKRLAQHTAVVDAAVRAGAALLAYTSVLGGPRSTFSIADEHNATERVVRESGIAYVLLRNGWYNENYTGYLAQTLQTGQVVASAGTGRLATAARADYAAAAATVLTDEQPTDDVLELSGDTAWSFAEFAAELSRQAGREVTYTPMSGAQYRDFMISAGVSAQDAEALVDTELAIERGELAATPGDLRRLLGRPTTPIADTIAQALATAR